jgi:aminopeptidase-like protein
MSDRPDMFMPELMRKLFPICRSITGNGLRQTLRHIGEHIPLSLTEIPTGTACFDWTIPNEWNLRRARLIGPDGAIIADTDVHNLHVWNYSTPVQGTFTLEQLQPHLHSLPERPGAIPYRTCYYAPQWGFCIAHDARQKLQPGDYTVDIDTTLAPGSLTYGECVIPGETTAEVLIGCHSCHPSLANDNLSGIVIATQLARELLATKNRLTYRFLFNPGTIGAIAWLSKNVETTKRIRHGLVLSCLGDSGSIHYKQSRRGDAEIDRIVAHVLAAGWTSRHEVRPFIPYGYDERQYCSPGFNLPVGVLMRTPNSEFPEYHTSDDNLEFVNTESLLDSLDALRRVIGVIERNRTWVNTSPFCEPQLGKRGLYSLTGGSTAIQSQMPMARLWVLNQCDGRNDLLSIAQKSKLDFDAIAQAASELSAAGLLKAAI